MKPFTTTTRIEITIKQSMRGGWYAVRVADYKQNSLHCTRKTSRGALGVARRLWGDGVVAIN